MLLQVRMLMRMSAVVDVVRVVDDAAELWERAPQPQ
jgi:hypothetical protein